MEDFKQEPDVNNNSASDPRNWVELYGDYLYQYACARVRDEDQAKDLVQETFLAALEKPGRFEGRSSEKTWLTAILKYKIIDAYRVTAKQYSRVRDLSEKRADACFEPDSGHWTETAAPQPFATPADEILLNKESAMLLERCMKKLPPLWLNIFRMKHIDEADTTEICSSFTISPSNFWVIIHRAKVSLRACLQTKLS